MSDEPCRKLSGAFWRIGVDDDFDVEVFLVDSDADDAKVLFHCSMSDFDAFHIGQILVDAACKARIGRQGKARMN
jgi:hypothetical protein